jgi:peptidyl-prolyl cis-trans isomerase D
MLEVMRSHKFFSYLLIGIIFMITVTFVFWGIGGQDTGTAQQVVALIEDEMITLDKFWRAYDNEYKRVKDIYSDEEEIKKLNLKEGVLESLVDRTVILIAARKAGIMVTTDELRNEIVKMPYFQRDGVFDQGVYQRALSLNRLTPQIFEEELKNDLVFTKMSRLIRETVELTAGELETVESLRKSNNQIAEAFFASKNNLALKAYVEGVKRRMNIKVNWDLIS